MVNTQPQRILVLCTGNSARSQIAEGLFRSIGGDAIAVNSAGSEPATRVNPFAVQVMSEYGVDINGQQPKHMDQFVDHPFDYVITVCDNARDACPYFPGTVERLHWSYPDPAAVEGDDAAKLAAFRKVRDGLERQISDFVQNLTA